MSGIAQVMEHRWGTRVRLDVPVELMDADGNVVPALMCDASRSGALVQVNPRLALLSLVSIRLQKDTGDWLDACVVRYDPVGMGLEWLNPDSLRLHAPLQLPDSRSVAR